MLLLGAYPPKTLDDDERERSHEEWEDQREEESGADVAPQAREETQQATHGCEPSSLHLCEAVPWTAPIRSTTHRVVLLEG